MRLSRGKLVLRAALASQLREDASAYGLVVTGDEWRETRVWCSACGERRRTVEIRRYVRDEVPRGRVSRHGLFAECEECGESVSSSAGGLALATPEAQRLRRRHARTKLLPLREVERSGLRTFVVRIQDALGNAGIDVFFARDSLRLLEIQDATEAAA